MEYSINDWLNFYYGCLAWAVPGSEVYNNIIKKIESLENQLKVKA